MAKGKGVVFYQWRQVGCTVKPRFKGPLFKGLPLFKGQISADQFSLKYINYPHLGVTPIQGTVYR